MQNNTLKYVNQVYKDLNHCIVIGLTGRCGSGCSTAREILCSKEKMDPNPYLGNLHSNFADNSERDKNIILNYWANNLIEFDEIKVRGILVSFVLENTDVFFNLLNYAYPDKIGDGKKITNDFITYYQSRVSKCNNDLIEWDEAIDINASIWKGINENITKFIENITMKEYDFLFGGLEQICHVIRDFLKIYDSQQDKYTEIFQNIGNIVRKYGDLKVLKHGIPDIIDEKGVYAIVYRINMLIKILRRKEWILSNYNKECEKRSLPIKKSQVHVVIDGIKNVFEADYLRARYNSFYLIALTVDDEIRQQRLLLRKSLSYDQISLIDTREQASKAKKLYAIKMSQNSKFQDSKSMKLYHDLDKNCGDYLKDYFEAYVDDTYIFRMQDVDGCIQNADILINNNKSIDELKFVLMRYVCLMQHPGLVIPTKDEFCMQIAQNAKVNSGCISRQVGAVVSDAYGKVLSVGWNEPASTIDNECVACNRRSILKLFSHDDEMAYSYYELNQSEFRENIRNILIKLCGSDEGLSDLELKQRFRQMTKEKLQGLPLSYCFKDIYCTMKGEKNQVHTRAQHGEENALEACEKSKCVGGTLYTTSSSCELCAKKALSYNIQRIVYIEPYSGITNDHILGHMVKKGIKNVRDKRERTESIKIELFTGATQGAYAKLYTPVFPMKDELKMRGITLC